MTRAVVGRERELEAAAGLVGGLDQAAALVLAGGPGIGKTTIFNEAVARARPYCPVLSCRVSESEAPMAFAGLTDLVEPVIDEVMSALPEPQQRAIAVALLREEPGPGGLDQRAVHAAALSIIRALAERGPVLIAIDDLQWLDRSSARVLEFALRRAEALPVGVIACERLDGTRVMPLDLGAVIPRERCTRLTLGPLSLAALQRILKEDLGRTFPRRALLRVEQASAGNPFFALELARALPPDPLSGQALSVPDSLLGLVEERITDLPEPCRNQLLLTAAAGSASVELVLAATPGKRADALAAQDIAVDAGVIAVRGNRITFSHPLYAEGVYSTASTAERREAHRRLAEVVDGIEERARHLALAAPVEPDHDLASVLDAAAEHARRRGAPDVAAELADRALLFTPGDHAEERVRRTLTAGGYRYHAGDLSRAREMGEAALRDAADDETRAAALTLLGDVYAHEESFLEANRLFEEALEHVGEDLRTRAALELRLTYGLNVLGDFEAIATHAERAVTLAGRADDGGLVAEALAVSAMASCLLGRGIDEGKVERSLKLEDPSRGTPVAYRPSLIAGCIAIYAGRLERSVRILTELRRGLVERGEETNVPFVSGQLVWAACWQGRLESAATYAEESVDIASGIQADSLRCIGLAFAAVRAAYAGDQESTRRIATECRELAPRTSMQVAVLWAGWADAILALSLDDPQSADAALASFCVPYENEVPDPARSFFLPDEIEALVGLGHLERAQVLLESFAASARRLNRGWALMRAERCRALLLAARGALDEAAETARGALGLCGGLELRIEVARTSLVAGQLERRRRRKRAASDHLRKAVDEFDEMGARLWAKRARHELDRVGLRPSAPDELTASERRVAELAAAGLKNREVAAQLFMSPKTVEATLSRIYRKLEIHSRAELGARLGGHESPQM